MSKKSTSTTEFPAFIFGADAFKAGFEKLQSAFAGAENAAKDNLEAGIESAVIAGQGLQAINSEAYAFARKSVEEGVAVTRDLFAAKSPLEAFQIQAEFAKAQYFGFLRQAARFNELLTNTGKDSFAPLQTRADALVAAAK
jgi:phasin family protein